MRVFLGPEALNSAVPVGPGTGKVWFALQEAEAHHEDMACLGD